MGLLLAWNKILVPVAVVEPEGLGTHTQSIPGLHMIFRATTDAKSGRVAQSAKKGTPEPQRYSLLLRGGCREGLCESITDVGAWHLSELDGAA